MPSDANINPSGRRGSLGPGPLTFLMQQYQENETYIQEVIDASRTILQTVLDGLVPDACLKHSPLRTFFRILSGMLFILKTFTLGAKEEEVRVSLDLQDRTIEALRTGVVDDVHPSVTIADLISRLTQSIRTRFLRFAPIERSADGSGHGPAETTDPTSVDAAVAAAAATTASATTGVSMSPRTSTAEATPSVAAAHRMSFQGNQSNYTGWPTQHSHSHFAKSPFELFHPTHTHHNQHAVSSPTVSATHATATTSAAAHHDPLAGIPTLPINSSNINVAFMPPPASVYYNYYDPAATAAAAAGAGTGDEINDALSPHAHSAPGTGLGHHASAASMAPTQQTMTPTSDPAFIGAGRAASSPSSPVTTTATRTGSASTAAANSSGAGNGPSDWIALPLDQFFNSAAVGVDQGLGGTGPMVGEYDMLEVLLQEQGAPGVSAGGSGRD